MVPCLAGLVVMRSREDGANGQADRDLAPADETLDLGKTRETNGVRTPHPNRVAKELLVSRLEVRT